MCYAIRLIGIGKAENAVQVTKALQDSTNQSLSTQTVRNSMKKVGMKAVVKKKRLFTKRHKRERLDFALSYKNWTIDDWKKVFWSDETKINHLGSDGRQCVWEKNGEGSSDWLVEGTKKFGGGSLMMWGCMTWEGVGKIDGKMDGDFYVQIPDEELQEIIKFYNKTKDNIVMELVKYL